MNFRHPWYPVVFALEQRFGGLSIPGLIRYLSVVQFMVAMLGIMQPGYIEYLTFSVPQIQQLEFWRVFAFMFINGQPSPLFALITMMFMWFISDGLEQAWGAYKVNLFVFSTVILQIAILFVVGYAELQIEETSKTVPITSTQVLSLFGGQFLYANIIMAAAALNPNHEIRLMLVIPLKMKWLGFVVFAGAMLQAMRLTEIGGMLFFSASLLPFAMVFVPQFIHNFRHGQQVAARRRKFATHQMPDDDVFHRCAECGVTDQQDPEMDFRVAADDKEYCRNCLPEEAKKGG